MGVPAGADTAAESRDDELVLRQFPVSEPQGGDAGAAWHLCGIGIKSRSAFFAK